MRVSLTTTAAALLGLTSWAAASRTIIHKEGELVIQSPEEVGEVVLSPRPHEYTKPEDLPENWDWRNVDGISYVSTLLNQHIPTYCGSCWAHAAMSSLADRLRIQTKASQADIIPAIQALINCGDAGSCNGGDSNAANAWVYKNGGIPDVTCLQYQAQNMECSDFNTCRNCNHTFFKHKNTCFPVESYPKVTVLEYGSVTGDDEIMAEIYHRGPISCYIDANPLEDYTGGINEYEDTTATNHAIQLAGWGVDKETGTKYWVGRNSWGSYWGERGWFRIIRGGFYRPGTCFWAVPGFEE